jgi:hypothetical protein
MIWSGASADHCKCVVRLTFLEVVVLTSPKNFTEAEMGHFYEAKRSCAIHYGPHCNLTIDRRPRLNYSLVYYYLSNHREQWQFFDSAKTIDKITENFLVIICPVQRDQVYWKILQYCRRHTVVSTFGYKCVVVQNNPRQFSRNSECTSLRSHR